MTKEKKEKKTAKRKHGRCWVEKHKNCPGWGKRRRASGLTIYLCSCNCHVDNAEQIKGYATKWDAWQKGKRR